MRLAPRQLSRSIITSGLSASFPRSCIRDVNSPMEIPISRVIQIPRNLNNRTPGWPRESQSCEISHLSSTWKLDVFLQNIRNNSLSAFPYVVVVNRRNESLGWESDYLPKDVSCDFRRNKIQARDPEFSFSNKIPSEITFEIKRPSYKVPRSKKKHSTKISRHETRITR